MIDHFFVFKCKFFYADMRFIRLFLPLVRADIFISFLTLPLLSSVLFISPHYMIPFRLERYLAFYLSLNCFFAPVYSIHFHVFAYQAFQIKFISFTSFAIPRFFLSAVYNNLMRRKPIRLVFANARFSKLFFTFALVVQ